MPVIVYISCGDSCFRLVAESFNNWKPWHDARQCISPGTEIGSGISQNILLKPRSSRPVIIGSAKFSQRIERNFPLIN